MNNLPDSQPLSPVIHDSESILLQVSPLLFGGFVLMLILSNHAFFTECVSFLHNRVTRQLVETNRTWIARPFLYLSVLLLLASHLVEIMIWAYALVFANLAPNLQEAVYFSGSTYTTLGYGSDIMPESWNAITAVIALSGMFSIAWTTSSLMSMIGLFHPRSIGQAHHTSTRRPPEKID